eukprot:419222-Rhodomonas_salina.1
MYSNCKPTHPPYTLYRRTGHLHLFSLGCSPSVLKLSQTLNPRLKPRTANPMLTLYLLCDSGRENAVPNRLCSVVGHQETLTLWFLLACPEQLAAGGQKLQVEWSSLKLDRRPVIFCLFNFIKQCTGSTWALKGHANRHWSRRGPQEQHYVPKSCVVHISADDPRES